MKDLFDSAINLTDQQNVVHRYKSSALLLISRFSDTGVVIKRGVNGYIQFNGDDYSIEKPLCLPKMADLLDTSSHILVFYHKV